MIAEPLTDEQRELANDPWLLNHAHHLARKYANKGLDYDECVSAIHFRIVECARRYDSTAGATFRTFAVAQLWAAVSDLGRVDCRRGLTGISMRGKREKLPVFSLAEDFNVSRVASDGDTKSYDQSSILAVPDRGMADFLDHDNISAVLAGLSGRDQTIVRMYAFGNYTMKEIAGKIGISESGVCLRLQQIRRLLADPVRRRLDATA